MKQTKANAVVEQLLSEEKGGADLSTEDLRQAYLVDFTGDPGFLDSYFVRHNEGKYQYKVIGKYPGGYDMGDYYVTSFFVKPIEGPHGRAWTGDFPGITDLDTDDEEEARALFLSEKPKTKWSASLKKPAPRTGPAAESKLHERNWKVTLGIDLDQYDEDADPETIKTDLAKRLKAKVGEVRTRIGQHDAEALENYAMNMEDAVEIEDIDSVMADVYDWADAVGVWVGGDVDPDGDVDNHGHDSVDRGEIATGVE